MERNFSLGVIGFGVKGFFTENLDVVSLTLVTLLVSNAGTPESWFTFIWLMSMFDTFVSLVVLMVLFPAFSDFSNCDLKLKATKIYDIIVIQKCMDNKSTAPFHNFCTDTLQAALEHNVSQCCGIHSWFFRKFNAFEHCSSFVVRNGSNDCL